MCVCVCVMNYGVLKLHYLEITFISCVSWMCLVVVSLKYLKCLKHFCEERNHFMLIV